ncbi:MAG: hypothetical protein ABI402_01695 [Ferruginibacter sp.]
MTNNPKKENEGAVTSSESLSKKKSQLSIEVKNKLDLLSAEFEKKINEIRTKYFDKPNGLMVITGKSKNEIGFYIDLGSIKTPSES